MQLPCHAAARQHGESPASHVTRRKAPGLRLPVQKEKCRSVCSKCNRPASVTRCSSSTSH